MVLERRLTGGMVFAFVPSEFFKEGMFMKLWKLASATIFSLATFSLASLAQDQLFSGPTKEPTRSQLRHICDRRLVETNSGVRPDGNDATFQDLTRRERVAITACTQYLEADLAANELALFRSMINHCKADYPDANAAGPRSTTCEFDAVERFEPLKN